jgi:hypothetical protein
LQRTIVDNADCLIRFQRFDFRGERVMARVIKTRSMQHRRGSFEVVTGPRKIDVDERPSLLRISANGEVKSISVRLFLHHENIMQEEYNLAWVSRLRYVLSPDITIDPQDSTSFLKRMKWAKTPTNDELQISQIDEYQLPEMRDGYSNSSLCTFERKDWRRQWDDLLPRILGKIKGSKGEFCAIPFFVNISLLGYRKYFSGTNGVMTIPIASDWKALSDQCAVWEDEHPDTKLLFFDFPGVTDENYNCLFLEILLGYGQPALDGGDRGFVEWLQSEDSKKSCILFRKLCRRAHLKKKYALENASSGITDNRAILVDSEAIVWRLWYSSANQLFASLPADRRNELCITSLPNENAIAGEWYLALPTYSSASEVGMHVIEMLTTHEEELARLRSGVGLPTRKSFYSVGDEKDIAAMVSPYFSISRSLLRKLVNEAFDRSSIPCYTQVSAILASHLRRIIEIEESKDNTVEETIHGILSELESQLRFVESDLPLINGDPTH